MKKLLLFLSVIITVAFFQSCKETGTDAVYEMKVEILSPAENQSVSDTFFIGLGLTNIQRFYRAEYYVNSKLFYTLYSSQLSPVPVPVTSYDDSTQLKIHAKVYDEYNNEFISQVVTVVCYKFMPSDVTVSVENDSTLFAVWRDNASIETGYEVFLSSDDENYVKYASVQANTTNYRIQVPVISSQKWYVKVRAITQSSQSKFSKTVVEPLKMNPPIITSVTVFSDSLIVVNWADNNFYKKSYEVEIHGVGTRVVDKSQSSFSFQGNFRTNTTYPVRVGVRNDLSVAYSPYVQIIINFNGPINLRIANTENAKPTIRWDDNSMIESAFVIERKTPSDMQFFEIGRTAANVVEFVDSTADTTVQLRYRIKGITTNNNSSYYSAELAVEYTTVLELEKATTLSGLSTSPMLGNNGKLYASTGKSYREIDFNTGSIIRQFTQTSDSAYYSPSYQSLDPRGQFIAVNHSSTYSGTVPREQVYIWDIPTGNIISRITSSNKMVVFGFLSDNSTIVLLRGNTIYLYSIRESSLIRKYTYSAAGVCLDENEDVVYSASGDAIKSISLRDGMLNSYPVSGVTNLLSISGDFRYLTLQTTSGIKIWDIKNKAVIKDIALSSQATSAEVFPDQDLLIYHDTKTNAMKLSTMKNVLFDYSNWFEHSYSYKGKIVLTSSYSYKQFVFHDVWRKI